MRRSGETLLIRRPVILCVLLTSVVMRTFLVSAADATKEEDLRADIVYRCYNLMGEFGPEGVSVCVDGELSAMKALSGYPQQTGEIVQRCTRHVQATGWELARSCVDKGIAAARETKKD